MNSHFDMTIRIDKDGHKMGATAKIISQILCPCCGYIMTRYDNHIECRAEHCQMSGWKFEIPEVELRRCKEIFKVNPLAREVEKRFVTMFEKDNVVETVIRENIRDIEKGEPLTVSYKVEFSHDALIRMMK